MFLTPAQLEQRSCRLIREEVAQQNEEERLQTLYVGFSKNLEQMEALGFSHEDITLAAGLIYFDRKYRLSDAPFPTSTEALSSIFAELDQDPDTNRLLDWLAKNLPRFSRFSLEHPDTHTTLKSLMLAKGLALRDRNPSVLRSVIGLALREYSARAYDQGKLKNLLHTLS